MMGRGLRLAIVIAHQARNDGAFTPVKAGNVAMQHQIFSMFVMAAVANHVSRVVQQSACLDRKSTRLNSSHLGISYAVFCLKKKKNKNNRLKNKVKINIHYLLSL